MVNPPKKYVTVYRLLLVEDVLGKFPYGVCGTVFELR